MKNFYGCTLLSALLLFFSLPVFSQSTKSLFKEGDRLFKLEHYRNALPFLEKVIEAEPNNATAIFEAGVCYIHRYSKEKALAHILKAYTLDSNVSKYIHFWMGRAYHQNYMYDKAISEYNIYKESLKKSDSRAKDVEKYIGQTNNARQLTSSPENFKVSNLGPNINTIYSEHSPVTSSNDSTLLFTSRRKSEKTTKEDQDGEFYEDIFQSKKQANGEWSTPEHIHLNTSGHDASIQLFDNDTKLLLYREAKGGDIYLTEIESGDTWKEPQKFADINTADYEADAFITKDGKTAYFATNHYKKTGDLDIYYITKNDDGSWSKPKELIGKINTSEDEDAPFLTPDGKTLYFSSRGHKNMGGFDVFKSTMDADGNWSQPENLGFPINTPDDDVYYYMSVSGKKGYLSSYREGGFGEKDIYDIAPIPFDSIICTLKPVCKDELSYSIQSLKKTTKPISLSGKVENGQIVGKILSHNSYRLAVFTSKDTLYSETFEDPFTEASKVIRKEIAIKCPGDTAIVKDTIPEDSMLAGAYAHKYLFRKVYFEKNQTKLTPEAERELQIAAEILKKNPTAEVEIKGSTQKEENKTLAAKRAKVIEEKLKAMGVTNVKVSPETDTKGSGVDGRSVSLNVKLKKSLATNFDPNLIPEFSKGGTFVLRNVYFETAKADLKPEGKAELDVLYNILTENPSVSIEIAGHTDARGNDVLNQALSEKRAQSAVNYLISKGISKDRLTAKGYGETQPIADNETEEGRRINRRTELRVMKR